MISKQESLTSWTHSRHLRGPLRGLLDLQCDPCHQYLESCFYDFSFKLSDFIVSKWQVLHFRIIFPNTKILIHGLTKEITFSQTRLSKFWYASARSQETSQGYWANLLSWFRTVVVLELEDKVPGSKPGDRLWPMW